MNRCLGIIYLKKVLFAKCAIYAGAIWCFIYTGLPLGFGPLAKHELALNRQELKFIRLGSSGAAWGSGPNFGINS